jgi:hypothetical protein
MISAPGRSQASGADPNWQGATALELQADLCRQKSDNGCRIEDFHGRYLWAWLTLAQRSCVPLNGRHFRPPNKLGMNETDAPGANLPN